MSLCIKLASGLSAIERSIIRFFVIRAGVWSNILNREVNEQVTSHYLEMIRETEAAGHDWDHEKMSPLMDDMRKFRSESVKFAFGHVLSGLAIVLSIAALLVSILRHS